MEETLLNGQTIDQIAESSLGDLGLGDENLDAGPATPLPDSEKDAEDKPLARTDVVKVDVDPPIIKAAPKSWPKEAHEYWGKLDPKVQELVEKREADFHTGIEQYKTDAGFAKQIKDVVAPYQALINSAGVTPDVAIKGLLNAHYQLSSADEGQRTAFMANLLKGYRIDPVKLSAALGDTVTLQDPALKPLQDQINKLTADLTAGQKAQLDATTSQINKEVEAFASDPAHIYFNEVQVDMAHLIRGSNLTMKEAYERAVRANPTTWAKEEVRLHTEIETKVRKEADEAAAKARKARGTQVSGGTTERAPTELLGTMEDTMRETLKDIQNRVSS